MKTVEVLVTTRKGGLHDAPALLTLCEKCGNNAFVIFVLEGDLTHLQCTECNVTYCQGHCCADRSFPAA